MDPKAIFAALDVESGPVANSHNPIGKFTGGSGTNSSATGEANPGEEVAINGNTDLHTTIMFNGGGCVYGIRVERHPGLYDYAVFVDAQGPSGFGSGSGYLAFTDETNDTYKLSIYSSRRSVHSVRYNSKKPKIVKIQWNNTSI